VVVEFDGDEAAAKDVAMHVAAMKPVALTSADVPAELIEKERSVAAAKAEEDRKAAEAAGKPASRRDRCQAHRRRRAEVPQGSVAVQPAFVKNDKQTVEQMLKAANTTVKGFTLYVVGEGIEKKVDDFAAEVAAQVAAAKAVGLTGRRGRPPAALFLPPHSVHSNHTQGASPCLQPSLPTSASCSSCRARP
jgi:elongation factor Ts